MFVLHTDDHRQKKIKPGIVPSVYHLREHQKDVKVKQDSTKQFAQVFCYSEFRHESSAGIYIYTPFFPVTILQMYPAMQLEHIKFLSFVTLFLQLHETDNLVVVAFDI